ncbi:hypothetical protein E2C01_022695 [Portunus trituberculatus]|uniref:Uncharacterized protein n=1 Tax=Portunus trituberculatus TaxID=210409 RepID=A0A5B7E621_PORTR|nr:hypothetical protein [Portunus trituberculatus]
MLGALTLPQGLQTERMVRTLPGHALLQAAAATQRPQDHALDRWTLTICSREAPRISTSTCLPRVPCSALVCVQGHWWMDGKALRGGLQRERLTAAN